MFFVLLLMREKRVAPFPDLARQDNNDKNGATEGYCIAIPEQSSAQLPKLCAGNFSCFLRPKSTLRKTTKRLNDKSVKVKNHQIIQYTFIEMSQSLHLIDMTRLARFIACTLSALFHHCFSNSKAINTCKNTHFTQPSLP